jgi:hypothetical protein
MCRSGGRSWERTTEAVRDGYRERVRDVLLAAMNSGLVISEFRAMDAQYECVYVGRLP